MKLSMDNISFIALGILILGVIAVYIEDLLYKIKNGTKNSQDFDEIKERDKPTANNTDVPKEDSTEKRINPNDFDRM